MMMGPHAHELANRIVKHVATPAQLVMAGAGFQYYFIGADGSTVSGPTFPSFAELAEMHPSGDWVPLLDADNPLTGKQVNVDYIPNEQKDPGQHLLPGQRNGCKQAVHLQLRLRLLD